MKNFVSVVILFLSVGQSTHMFFAAPTAANSNERRISVGRGVSCFVTSSGAVKCWGDNNLGQLGGGTGGPMSSIPVEVSKLGESATAVAVDEEGHNVCVLMKGGSVKCWGENNQGQLGNGVSGAAPSPIPVTVQGINGDAVAIAVGYWHACALTKSGGVKCWGNPYTALPNFGWSIGAQSGICNNSSPAKSTCAVAHDVPGLTSGVVAVSAAFDTSCSLLTNGAVKCWGADGNGDVDGQMHGYPGNAGYPPSAADVLGLTSGVAAISSGRGHSCALMVAGGVKCWGYDYSTLNSNGPALTDEPGLSSGVAAISVAERSTCAVMTDGSVRCLGRIPGTQGDWLPPRTVAGLSGPASAISIGPDHACILVGSDDVWCFGSNNTGQLGNGTYTGSATPVEVLLN